MLGLVVRASGYGMLFQLRKMLSSYSLAECAPELHTARTSTPLPHPASPALTHLFAAGAAPENVQLVGDSVGAKFVLQVLACMGDDPRPASVPMPSLLPLSDSADSADPSDEGEAEKIGCWLSIVANCAISLK